MVQQNRVDFDHDLAVFVLFPNGSILEQGYVGEIGSSRCPGDILGLVESLSSVIRASHENVRSLFVPGRVDPGQNCVSLIVGANCRVV